MIFALRWPFFSLCLWLCPQKSEEVYYYKTLWRGMTRGEDGCWRRWLEPPCCAVPYCAVLYCAGLILYCEYCSGKISQVECARILLERTSMPVRRDGQRGIIGLFLPPVPLLSRLTPTHWIFYGQWENFATSFPFWQIFFFLVSVWASICVAFRQVNNSSAAYSLSRHLFSSFRIIQESLDWSSLKVKKSRSNVAF